MPSKPIRATLLKRYTHLPALLAMLQRREITILSPDTWEDKNDRVFMAEYAKSKELETLLGICFSQAAETFHHWKIFAPGASGVCVEFHKAQLLEVVAANGFLHKRITYKRPASLLGSYSTVSQLPFIKGWAFRDEKEYRVIYSSKTECIKLKSFPIPLNVIRSIVVNPWLPAPLFEATRKAIAKVVGCSRIPVVHSKVIDNENWQAYASRCA